MDWWMFYFKMYANLCNVLSNVCYVKFQLYAIQDICIFKYGFKDFGTLMHTAPDLYTDRLLKELSHASFKNANPSRTSLQNYSHL